MGPFVPPSTLRIGRGMLDAVVAHLRAEAPLEGVGLLATVVDGDTAEACRFYPGTNVDASTTRYTMDPVEVLAALADIEANGWDFGAIVHSHPRSRPVPSATDLREAFYPDQLLLIVGLAARPPTARSWSVRPAVWSGSATVKEVPIVVETDGIKVPVGTAARAADTAAPDRVLANGRRWNPAAPEVSERG